ncbi:MAG: hypothetical protein EOM23_12135 [Candidatus Moranbacteria bacterium]|nr:hypothetical protein [Candidatus Moranbacteria bacterium]
MKNLIIILAIILGFSVYGQSQTPVPFAYDATIEWTKVSAEAQKILLSYANAGEYGQEITAEIDSINQVILVEGIKSRSGNVEDQVWLQGQKDGKEINLLLALKNLPQISDRCCVLTITAYRGDSDAMSRTKKNPGLKRNPW